MNLSQISAYDVCVFGAIYIIIIVIFLIGLIASGKIKAIILSLALLIFLSSPILTLLIMYNYINYAQLSINTANKLSYIDSFFISGTITNQGKRDLNTCKLNIYINRFYPLQQPEYTILLENIGLKRHTSFEFNKMIDKFNGDSAKRIAIICF